VIDPQILRNDPEVIRESQRRRGEDTQVVDLLVAADIAARDEQRVFDELRNSQKTLSKEIGPLQGQLKKNPSSELQQQVDQLMERASNLAAAVKAACRSAGESSSRTIARPMSLVPPSSRMV